MLFRSSLCRSRVTPPRLRLSIVVVMKVANYTIERRVVGPRILANSSGTRHRSLLAMTWLISPTRRMPILLSTNWILTHMPITARPSAPTINTYGPDPQNSGPSAPAMVRSVPPCCEDQEANVMLGLPRFRGVSYPSKKRTQPAHWVRTPADSTLLIRANLGPYSPDLRSVWPHNTSQCLFMTLVVHVLASPVFPWPRPWTISLAANRSHKKHLSAFTLTYMALSSLCTSSPLCRVQCAVAASPMISARNDGRRARRPFVQCVLMMSLISDYPSCRGHTCGRRFASRRYRCQECLRSMPYLVTSHIHVPNTLSYYATASLPSIELISARIVCILVYRCA